MDGIVLAHHFLTSKRSKIKDLHGTKSETFDKAYL